jgi:hypothetical protein
MPRPRQKHNWVKTGLEIPSSSRLTLVKDIPEVLVHTRGHE